MEKVIHFKLSEFIIDGSELINTTIADKLYHHHIFPMLPVREELGMAIWASLKSGYRSEEWEKSKGRSGNSQHCFKEESKGAVDWTCMHFDLNGQKLLDLMKKKTGYTRLALYKGFIHGDYKKTASGRREVYISDAKSNWQFVGYAD